MDLSDICLKVCDIARKAGGFIRKEAASFNSSLIEVKGLHNFVSYVDKGAEKIIIEALSQLIPDSAFLAEEGTVENRAESRFRWIIDPLDGTTNFIHGLPPYSVSIALSDGEDIVLGVVYEVCLDECFYAWKNGGAWLNGTPVKVSSRAGLRDSLIATGFPYTDFQNMAGYMASLDWFMRNTHGARRLGSAAADLAYVACGRVEAFYEYSLQPWDVAAGAIIIREAGGCVSDFSGGGNFIYGKEIIATNSMVFEEFSLVVRKFMAINNKDTGNNA